MKQIPFFDYQALFECQETGIMEVIHDVLSRGAFIMQKDLLEFEKNISDYLGVKHVIGVADGTIALLMSLRAAGIGAGDEVIVPSHTFVASAASIYHVGAKPVLADCGSDHLIDPLSIKQHISSKTRAIMPVQLNGRTANMDPIYTLAEQYNLKIIEDSAQALGSKYKKQFAGTFGLAGTCSFYPSKTLGCFGDGGAVLTNEDSIAESIRLLRDHGRDPITGDVITWGYNARLDNLQAAILNLKLKSYDEAIERRRWIATMYNDQLSDLDLILPPAPDSDPNHFDIYQNYEVESDQRDTLRQYLENNGVKTILQWGGKTIHQFKKLGLNNNLPATDNLTKRFFLLPMNTSLSDEDVTYICEVIRKFYKSNKVI